MALFSLIVCIGLVLAAVGSKPAAAFPAPVQFFYVTLPENDGLTVLDAVNTAAVSPTYTYFSIAISTNGTYIYYDQWEDGYAVDVANPTSAEIYNSSTNPGGVQVWGNGVASDGCAPNINGVTFTCTDAVDVFIAGDVIIPYNAVTVPRNTAQNYVLDNFDTAAYNNNNGNTNWNGNWIETNDDGSATTGSIYIPTFSGGYQLRFRSTTGTEAGDTIDRGVDLSTSGSCATLNFTLGQNGIDANEDRLAVQASSDGTSYTTMSTYTSSADAGSKSIDISGYATPNTRVRFIIMDELETSEYWSVDNAQVSWNCTTPILFDARDKVATTSTISMARMFWASGSGTLNAFGHEMYSTSEWGTEYEVPVGIGTTNSGYMFEYSALTIMASENSTSVQIDANADGTYETTVPLNEGDTTLVANTVAGAKVLSDKPVQVVLLTGDVSSNYASRDMNLLPVSSFGSSYWSPVGVVYGSDNTRLFLYNPTGNVTPSNPTGSIYITCEVYNTATPTIPTVTTQGPVATRGVVTWDLQNNQGAHCFASTSGGVATTDKIFGIGTIDTSIADSGSTAYDWSFTLFPDDFLTTEALVGLGLGRDPTYSGGSTSQNGSPLWVTAACSSGSTYVYVDWNNDGVADQVDTDGDGTANTGTENGILVNRLQSQRLFEPPLDTEPYDQSGARVWSRTASGYPNRTDPNATAGCTLAVAWGEDPQTASAASPGLDVGTSVPPLRLIEGSKELTLKVDADGDGVLSPGDTATYLMTVRNIGSSIVNNVALYDTVPTNTSYVPNTTEKDVGAGWVSVPDDGSGTPFPLDVSGGVMLGNLVVGGEFYVRFDIVLDNNYTFEQIKNCDIALAPGVRITNCVTDLVATKDWGDLPDTYKTTYASNGPRHTKGTVWLGRNFDRELQGQPSADAFGDDNNQTTLPKADDEDGVRLNTFTENSKLLIIDVVCNSSGGNGTGWLVVWFDWDENGSFSSSETTFNTAITCNGTTQPFSYIFSVTRPETIYYRARLFETEPADPANAWLGLVDGGEVEDYYWYGPTSAFMSAPVAKLVGSTIQIDWQTASEMDVLGFDLYRSVRKNGADRMLIYSVPAKHMGQMVGDSYQYIDKDITSLKTYTYWLEVRLKDGTILTFDPMTFKVKRIILPKN